MVTAGWLANRLREVFWEAMSEEISDGEVSLFHELRETGAFVIRGREDQELFFLTSEGMDNFFALHLPDLVSFQERRLLEWAREAIIFFQQNHKHTEFVRIFSRQLHYDVTVRSLIQIDSSTKGLVKYLRDDLALKSVHVADRYPAKFQRIVKAIADRAVEQSLSILGSELAANAPKNERNRPPDLTRLSKLRKEPSFRDIRGSVPFLVRDELLTIAGSPLSSKAPEYRSLVLRALRNLHAGNALQRIHNKDPMVNNLIREYENELSRGNDVSVPTLWIIGNDIDSRIKLHQKNAEKDDALDGDDLFLIANFLTTHNIYLQCFEMAATITDDLERSMSLYRRLDEGAKDSPWVLLDRIGKSQAVVESRSGAVMQKASATITQGIESRGMIAIGLGLLRGVLHAIGGALITAATNVISKAVEEIGKEGLIGALKEAGVYEPMLILLQTHMLLLLQISGDLPHYFSWVRRLLEILGIA